MGIPGTIDVFLFDGGAVSIKGVVAGAAQARGFLGRSEVGSVWRGAVELVGHRER